MTRKPSIAVRQRIFFSLFFSLGVVLFCQTVHFQGINTNILTNTYTHIHIYERNQIIYNLPAFIHDIQFSMRHQNLSNHVELFSVRNYD